MMVSNSPSLSPQIIPVLGLPLHLHENYEAWLAQRVQTGQSTHVVTLNAEMAMQAQSNPELAQCIHQADLSIPDGSGVVFYLYLRGHRSDRVPGIEVAENLLKRAAQESWSVFFYGGKPGVPEVAQENWQKAHPQLAIVGVQHGYLQASEEDLLLDRLKTLQPQIILVGLGVPRQELWIQQHRHLCPRATWIGVGGSFDIWAGVKERAPQWFQDNHLEWMYRLYQEPWRWRRMLALPHFAWKALQWKD
ncbi:MAG: WecB/TagA/CpsF family glycosyltransferase [Prochlorotrichaceae cyanobacterium]|jgi:N-acetylglucosaminyldiphosphoundecaprenol N-acetyl-beta-D-mannosaminyltransferase